MNTDGMVLEGEEQNAFKFHELFLGVTALAESERRI
jgi:hypothetical protein